MEYILGIDAGVENTGYALTNENYEVVKVKGRNAMGVLTYDTAETAEVRRNFRTTRRRLMRRQYRVDLLQEIFNDRLMQKDNNFLRRLDENDLKSEDRKIEGKFSLFNDKNFNDKTYYKKYPTIYHLRKELIEKSTEDIRLLYLAVHHIVKYRGHFLVEGSVAECTDAMKIFERVNELLSQRNEQLQNNDNLEMKINIIDELDLSNISQLKDLISNQGSITEELLEEIKQRQPQYNRVYISKKDRLQKSYELLGAKSSAQKSIVNIIFGNKVNLTTIFGADEYPKEDINGFYFSEDLEEVADIKVLAEDNTNYELILQLKTIYDWVTLNSMLKGEESISTAMVKLYDYHKQDLLLLKNLIQTYDNANYDIIFGDNNKGKIANYSSYIGGGTYKHKKLGNNGRIGKTCTREDFLKFIKKIVENIKDSQAEEMKTQVLLRIENDEFMPKIVSKRNAAIPYQLNMLELDKILARALESGHFDFLKKVENNWTNVEKIKSLLQFRIPYYVGPVKFYHNDKSRSKNAWAVRKAQGRITPWTFESLIDSQESNKAFITRMTNKCTYLKNAITLPKNSILFSKFNALNELNKLKINGESIDIKTKQSIFNEIYLKEKVTIKKVYRYLINVLKFDADIKITGYDTELKGNMNTYITYKRVLGTKVDKYPNMIEDLIFLSTIHQESRMIVKAVEEKYKDILSDKEIKDIKGFRFNGWGSLSARFLAGYKNKGIKLIFDGEYVDIIDIMYDTNLNLQQILYDPKCNFQEALNNYNEANNIVQNNKITYDDIEQMYCSPSVKRCVWQAFTLIKDIIKQTKIIPDKIYIESTRTNTDFQKGKRSKTRREIIEAAYREAKDFASELNEMRLQLKGKTDGELKSEKVFLYFMQLGKCMYTGDSIDLESLSKNNFYDVDHIIPQSTTKDDSLNNKVLVKQEANKEKDSKYPIPAEYRQISLWKKLNESKLISDEKFSRLIRTAPFTSEEQEKFLNRQLVETNQTVLLLRDILIRYCEGITDKSVEIVLSKANNVSDFRKAYNLTKSRDVNDTHHATDAYLNIVVGDILNKKFNHNWSFKSNYSNLDKSINFANYLKRKVSENNDKILNTIKNEIDTCNFTMVKKIQDGKGQLYKETIFPADNSDKSALYGRCQSKIVDGVEQNPKSNTKKYGGFKTSGTAYFVIVDSNDKKGNAIRTIEDISIYNNHMLLNGKTTMNQILTEKGLKNATLARIKGLNNSKLQVGSLLDFGKFRLRLAGANEKVLAFHNANQLYVDNNTNSYIKELSLMIEKTNKLAKKDELKNEIILNEYLERLEKEKENRLNRKNQQSIIVTITKARNREIYEFFIKKLSSHPYKDIPTFSRLLNILEKSKECFETHNLYNQIVLLMKIIVAFQCNPSEVDVSKLHYTEIDKNGKAVDKKGGERQCNITTNKNISNKKIFFISQSKSGLKEKRIDISL